MFGKCLKINTFKHLQIVNSVLLLIGIDINLNKKICLKVCLQTIDKESVADMHPLNVRHSYMKAASP